MNSVPSSSAFGRKALLLCVAVLVLLLSVLFYKAFLPNCVVFSNDGPLGAMMAEENRMPAILTGLWVDQNWIGSPYPAPAPNLSSLLRLITSPLLFSKVYAPLSLFFLGLCAWACFWQHRFSPLACLLVAVAAALNSEFVGTSAWGVCMQPIAFGFNFLAIGALADPAAPRRWLRVMLAGFAVGLGVSEAYDIGALFSLVVAAFVVVQSLASNGPVVKRIFNGVSRLAVVGACAGLIAAAAVSTLIVGAQIKGVAGMEQDAKSKAARWSYATQYSVPKVETLNIVVPGIFGLRHDSPDGKEYWGRIGSDLSWDEFVESDGQKGQPRGPFRAGAGSSYAGIVVLLLAAFGIAQSFRREAGPLTGMERRMVWFWGAVVVVSGLLMFGRFAPFYQFFYALPYTSTIRNPAKFQHILQWALVILCAYGAEALWRTGLKDKLTDQRGLVAHWQSWWARARGFDRRWIIGSLLGLVAFGLIWGIYAASRGAVENYIVQLTQLQYAGTGQNADSAAAAEAAKATAGFSIGQVGRTFGFLLLGVVLMAVALSGYFRGPRVKLGVGLLLTLVVADLWLPARPWVVFVNWRVKCESNPVIEFLRERPYEQRVALFPLERFMDFRRLPREMMPLVQQYSFFAQLYGIEWTQHLFKYNNIQTLDIRQEPRVSQDKAAYEAVLALASPLRRWELSNTRYLLGPAPLVESFNQQLDSGKGRFRIATRFDLAAKSGVDQSVPQLEQITTVLNTNGQLAVIEFTGALPRARLYSDWRVGSNSPALLSDWAKSIEQRVPQDMAAALAAQSATDLATLHELVSPDFNPAQTVLLAEPLPVAPGTNQNSGEVKFESYKVKHIVLAAKADAPSVLLLNDKFDPNWKVTVDGQPAKLLRANFIVRGVFLPQAGEYRVEFKYQPPLTGLYVSLVSIAIALGLLAYVGFGKRR